MHPFQMFRILDHFDARGPTAILYPPPVSVDVGLITCLRPSQCAKLDPTMGRKREAIMSLMKPYLVHYMCFWRLYTEGNSTL